MKRAELGRRFPDWRLGQLVAMSPGGRIQEMGGGQAPMSNHEAHRASQISKFTGTAGLRVSGPLMRRDGFSSVTTV